MILKKIHNKKGFRLPLGIFHRETFLQRIDNTAGYVSGMYEIFLRG